MNYNIINIIIICLMSVSALYSQNQTPQPSNTQPIELPNFIIEGREQINVPSGIKQHPDKPGSLSQSELDSLNTLEKQQHFLIPTKPFPNQIISYPKEIGFVKAEFGRFLTPLFEAGYGYKKDEYDLMANAGAEYSQGHIDNSDYTKLFLKSALDYTAPLKYWIFGGSKTTFALNFLNQNYGLYARSKSIMRSGMNLDLGVDCQGNYEGFIFSTGAGFQTLQLGTNDRHDFDNGIDAYLRIIRPGDVSLGINAQFDIHSVGGNAANFLQANALARINRGLFSLEAQVGFQGANSSKGISRGGVLLLAALEYKINHLFTLKAGAESGIENVTFTNLYKNNPYISDTAQVDFPYNLVLIKGFLFYHPNELLALSAGLKYKLTNRLAFFTNADTGKFFANYYDANQFEFILEGNMSISEKDKISGNLRYCSSVLTENSKTTPYLPSFQLTTAYYRRWINSFGTEIELTYFGERYTDIENTKTIDGFFDISIDLNYYLNKNLIIYGKFENLLNSDIIIWDGYKERSLFLSVGIVYNF